MKVISLKHLSNEYDFNFDVPVVIAVNTISIENTTEFEKYGGVDYKNLSLFE